MTKRRVLTVTYTYYQNDTIVPSLKILGKWLKEDFGFAIGETVEVFQQQPNELIIRKICVPVK